MDCIFSKDSCNDTASSYVYNVFALLNCQSCACFVLRKVCFCLIQLFGVVQHEDAENIGYVIPTPVMEHFINDYERNGQYTAFPALGIEWQKMESPFMRKALGMQVGVLIVCLCALCGDMSDPQ